MTRESVVDRPPVAATEDGGPKTAPPLYVPERQFEYEIVPGFFLQDKGDKNVEFETDIVSSTRKLTGDRIADLQRDKSFGMLDQSPERWTNFQRRVEELQRNAPPGVQYKALFLGRHGQGWHNYCSDKYGVEVSLSAVEPNPSLLPCCSGPSHPVAPLFLWFFCDRASSAAAATERTELTAAMGGRDGIH